jgi:tetratricopeptide (TPR) repeat protein
VFKLQLDYKPAIADYSKAIELNPLFVNAYNSRSTLRGITGDRVGEEADLNKAIAIDSTFHMAWYNRGNFWYDKGNHEKAIADYSQAIVIKPDYSSAFFNRANSYDEMKQYALGLADYDSYFKYQQDSLEPELVAEAYHLRASDKFILADTAGACADWKTADEQGFVRAKAKLQQFCK